MNKKVKIVLADDTLIAREGWKRILETADDIEIVGEAQTAAETVERIRELKPDVLLMDLLWYGDDLAGWGAIHEIKQEHGAKVKIIAITAYDHLIRDARHAGADSALLKTFTREQLLNEVYTQAARPKTDVHPASLAPTNESLTARELEVLQLLAEGHRDKEIASMLTIAPTTAKNHVKSILEKLNAKNRTQAVSLAREMGLLN
jgi:two-component system, NarL family, response regulator YdfI